MSTLAARLRSRFRRHGGSVPTRPPAPDEELVIISPGDAQPAPGTTRYLCPLGCGWHHDVPPPGLADLAGITPEPPARDLSEAISSIATQAGLRQARWTEQAVRDHLAAHTSEAEVAAIRQLLADSGRGDVEWPP